jgi:uncharacterized membrane protein YheB (UPF0754 family)
MENTDFLNIQGWMINELNLKGNELIIYALIYGFTKDGVSEFRGSRQYMADWTNSSVRSVQNVVNSLVNKGMIEKINHINKYGSLETSGYKAINVPKLSSEKNSLVEKKVHEGSEKSSPPLEKKVHEGSEKSSHNNIDNNISNNIVDIKEKNIKKESVNSVISEYTENKDLQDALHDFVDMRTKARKPLTARAMKLSLNELDKLAVDDMTKVAIVNQSIMHNWLTFYKLQNNNNGGQRQLTRKEMGYAF